MSHFYTPWKRQKTKGFLTFSGGIEMEYWVKMSYNEHLIEHNFKTKFKMFFSIFLYLNKFHWQYFDAYRFNMIYRFSLN